VGSFVKNALVIKEGNYAKIEAINIKGFFMNKKQKLLLGAHMSIEGGLEKSIERGASIGCTTIQIFTKSNRQWRAKKITEKEAALFKDIQKKHSVFPVVAHCSYLVNLGSPNLEVQTKSTNALAEELNRCNLLDIPYLVLHPGARLTSDANDCVKAIAQNIDRAIALSTGKTMVLLETMAGQGSVIGATLEEIAQIRKLVKEKQRVGVCLDTCHVFAAGYDFTSKSTYKNFWENFDSTIGIKHLKVVHINDSKKELGSRVDRHETIGNGKIDIEGFKLLFNDERFFNIPKILETPKTSIEEDRENMDYLEKLFSDKTRETYNL
jgi:deoxyribonuclease-4